MFKIPAFFIRLFFVLFFLISILFVLQSKKSFPKEVLAVPGALILPSTASYVTVTSTNITTTSLTLGGVLVTVNGSKLNMLSGVTSEIQAQINLKAPTASPTFTGIATAPTFSGALSGNATTATTATTANALSFNGGLTTTSNPTFNSVYLADTNQRIYQGAGTSLHTQTAYGYIEIGPQNTSWAHLQTDRPAFYFNKQVTIDGNLCKYTGNCYDINTLIYSGNIGSQSVNYAASAPWSGISGKPTAITRIQDLTGSYGSINVAGTTNGYAGINFVDEGSTFMVDLGGATGMYRNTGSWQWYFDSNGSLTAGSVPWGNVSGKPTTVAGYGITDMGSQSVNNATNATNVVPGGNVYTDTVNTASANDALEINYYRSGAVKICATLNCGLVSAFFAQSGNVGIGTITPGAQLDVAPIPLVPWDNFTVGDDRSWDGTTSHVGISDGHHHLMFNTTPHLTYQAANGGAFVRMAAAANAANSWDMGLLADVFTIRRNGTGSFLTINNGGLATFSGNVTAPTFVGNLTGVASNATQATTATSLTSMNISQFTNNSGYITAGNSSFTGQYIYQDYAAQAAHNILGYAGWILGYASKGLFQYSNNFIYPGRVDAAGFWQNSWYLASHASYGLYTNTGLYTAGNITAPSAVFSAAVTSPNFAVTAGEGNGVRFWQSDDYKISMGNGAEYHYGYVNDYSVKMNMTNGIGRGFTWGSNGTAVASLNASSGSMQIAGNFIALGSAAIGKTVLNAPLDVGHGNDAIAFYNYSDNRMSIQSYIDGAWSNRATYSPGETRLLLQPVVGYVGIGTADGNYLYKLFVNGSTANTTGVWANLSDARAKKDIAPISNALDIILKLNPVSFNWIDQKKNQELGRVRGFIAQDVEKVIPEWIIVDKTNGYKNLQPIGMDAMLVGSIKELNTKIISQQTEITSLQSIVADITKEISTQLIKTKKLIVDGVDILKKLNELSDIVSKQQKEIEEMKQTIKLLKGEKK